MTIARTVISVLGLPLCLLAAGQCSAENMEFRVETAIFVANEDQPASRPLTLFVDEQVYDFPEGRTGDEVIAILDVNQELFTLLNRTHAVQTSVYTKRLALHADDIAKRVRSSKSSPWLKELAHPALRVAEVRKNGVSLAGDLIRYEVQGSPFQDPAVMRRYYRFADSMARLNYFLMDWPPQARLKLNDVLRAQQLKPESVQLSMQTAPARAYKTNSSHRFRSHLTLDDRKKIAQANLDRDRLKIIAFEAYLKRTEQGPDARPNGGQ